MKQLTQLYFVLYIYCSQMPQLWLWWYWWYGVPSQPSQSLNIGRHSGRIFLLPYTTTTITILYSSSFFHRAKITSKSSLIFNLFSMSMWLNSVGICSKKKSLIIFHYVHVCLSHWNYRNHIWMYQKRPPMSYHHAIM